MGTDCSYCGSDVSDHTPVYVQEPTDDGRELIGQFCNYACLKTYIEDEGLTDGARCRIDY